nr:hypothetical protein [Tanacetum cinerariifolium]
DCDYEERTIVLNDIISQIPQSIVITSSLPVLPLEDPEVSLILGNEELNTIPEKAIPEKESNEFIKSSIEDLVPIPNLNQQQINNAIDDKMKESHNELLNMVKLFFEHILRQREQAANLVLILP